MVGGAPLVIKLLEGTQGIGVVLAETRQAAESVIEAFFGLKANILVQEYIKRGRRRRHPLLRHRRQGGGGDEAAGEGGRVPLQPAPRRRGLQGQADAGGALDRVARRATRSG
jgi:glutathione synthase/RimK-type ligase-like ATP-grasp enzyme